MFNPSDREFRILEKIAKFKKRKATVKRVKRKPIKNYQNAVGRYDSKQNQLKQVENILFNAPKGQKATVTLEKVLKLIK